MKITMSKIHLESLDKKRQEIFHQLSSFRNIGYLAGGTALTLQLNHRVSEDFDIFINKTVDNKLRLKVKEIFGEVNYYVDNSDQISFITKNGVKITFLWYYYNRLFSTVKTPIISLASVTDISADKAQTLGRRAVWRDYVDLFFLMKTKVMTLVKIISSAQKKFKGEFIETQFLEQLSYFKDLQISPVDFIKKTYSLFEIKSFLENQVKIYVKQNLKI